MPDSSESIRKNAVILFKAMGVSEGQPKNKNDIGHPRFQQIINDPCMLVNLIHWDDAKAVAPDAANAIIETILQSPEILQNVVFNTFTFTFTEFIKNFPEHLATLLNKVFENSELANKVISSERDLLLLGKIYPDWSDALLDKVLEDPKLRSNVIKTRYHLEQITERYPHKTEDLIKHTKILEDPRVFRSLVDSESLGEIRGLSAKAEYCLRLLVKAFPGYDAFKKSTVTEAFSRFKEERESTIQIQEAAVVIAQGERTNTPFQRLPTNINNYIAGFFGTHGVSEGGKVRGAMQDARGKIAGLRS